MSRLNIVYVLLFLQLTNNRIINGNQIEKNDEELDDSLALDHFYGHSHLLEDTQKKLPPIRNIAERIARTPLDIAASALAKARSAFAGDPYEYFSIPHQNQHFRSAFIMPQRPPTKSLYQILNELIKWCQVVCQNKDRCSCPRLVDDATPARDRMAEDEAFSNPTATEYWE